MDDIKTKHRNSKEIGVREEIIFMNLLSIIKTKIFIFLKYFYFVEITSKPKQVIVQRAEPFIFRNVFPQSHFLLSITLNYVILFKEIKIRAEHSTCG